MPMRSEVRLMSIKEKDVSYHLGGTSLESDWEWLIKQAETLQKIADRWCEIEFDQNGEPSDFHSDVQDLLGENGDY